VVDLGGQVKRIYVDKNVYSALKTNTKYLELTDKLINSKESSIFLFSDAHIDDLMRDASVFKFSDLDFIERFTEDNYLHLNNFNNGCGISYLTPKDVFNKKQIESKTSDNILSLDTIKSLKEIPEFKELSILFNSIEELKKVADEAPKTQLIDFIPENPSAEMQEYINKLGIENKEYDKDEWVKLSNEISDKIQNDEGLFKMGRRLGIKDLGLENFNISINDINFDEKLRDTKLGKSFTEAVNTALEPLRKIPLSDNFFAEYTVSYMMMNILGIDEEKNKKAKFKNTLTDSHHSFYGMYSDYFVSSDKGLITKTKVLYNLYGIRTRVLFLDEFIEEFSFLDDNFKDATSFIKMLKYNIKNSPIIQHKSSLQSETKSQKQLLPNRYFSYFNTLETHFLPESVTFIFYNQRTGINDFLMVKEFKSVVNKVHKLFGSDLSGKDEFHDSDLQELQQNEWSGRVWSIGDSSISLKYLQEQNRLILTLCLI